MKTKRSHDPFSVGSRGTDCKLKQVENKVKCFLEIKKQLVLFNCKLGNYSQLNERYGKHGVSTKLTNCKFLTMFTKWVLGYHTLFLMYMES